jgi:hypothetical protein
MHRLARSLALVATSSLIAAVGAQADPGGKSGVCHGTASAKNPMVMINVSDNALPALLSGGKQRKADDALANADGTCGADQGGDF